MVAQIKKKHLLSSGRELLFGQQTVNFLSVSNQGCTESHLYMIDLQYTVTIAPGVDTSLISVYVLLSLLVSGSRLTGVCHQNYHLL